MRHQLPQNYGVQDHEYNTTYYFHNSPPLFLWLIWAFQSPSSAIALLEISWPGGTLLSFCTTQISRKRLARCNLTSRKVSRVPSLGGYPWYLGGIRNTGLAFGEKLVKMGRCQAHIAGHMRTQAAASTI